jgi:hypothetical protein
MSIGFGDGSFRCRPSAVRSNGFDLKRESTGDGLRFAPAAQRIDAARSAGRGFLSSSFKNAPQRPSGRVSPWPPTHAS